MSLQAASSSENSPGAFYTVRFIIYPGSLSAERLVVLMQGLIKDARR